MKICQNPNCEKEIIGRTRNARYCSNDCKKDAFYERKSKSRGLGSTMSLQTNGMGSEVQYQFIIKELERDRDHKDKQLLDAVHSNKKVKVKNQELKEKIATLETEKRIEDIKRTHSTQNTLGSVMETHGDLIKEVAPQVVPPLIEMFQNLVTKMSSGSAPLQMGSIPQATNSVAQKIMTWLSQLDEDHSKAVMQLLTDINTKSNDNKAVSIQLITQLLNIINNGTSIASQA